MSKSNRVGKLLGLAFGSLAGGTRRRYESRYKLLDALAARLGYRMYNMNLKWFKDAEYRRVWQMFPEGDDTIHERRFNLYNLAKAATGVPGDLVECGVFRGAGSHLILSANTGADKSLHVFDSFEGLSSPGAFDRVEDQRAFQWEATDLSVPEAIVRNNLRGFDRVHYYRGWIPSRFHEVAQNRFALVHIDVDLYQPTLDSLEFFYERTEPGGLIICDDYGFETCPGAHRAMNEFFDDKLEQIVHLTTGQGLVIKR